MNANSERLLIEISDNAKKTTTGLIIASVSLVIIWMGFIKIYEQIYQYFPQLVKSIAALPELKEQRRSLNRSNSSIEEEINVAINKREKFDKTKELSERKYDIREGITRNKDEINRKNETIDRVFEKITVSFKFMGFEIPFDSQFAPAAWLCLYAAVLGYVFSSRRRVLSCFYRYSMICLDGHQSHADSATEQTCFRPLDEAYMDLPFWVHPFPKVYNNDNGRIFATKIQRLRSIKAEVSILLLVISLIFFCHVLYSQFAIIVVFSQRNGLPLVSVLMSTLAVVTVAVLLAVWRLPSAGWIEIGVSGSSFSRRESIKIGAAALIAASLPAALAIAMPWRGRRPRFRKKTKPARAPGMSTLFINRNSNVIQYSDERRVIMKIRNKEARNFAPISLGEFLEKSRDSVEQIRINLSTYSSAMESIAITCIKRKNEDRAIDILFTALHYDAANRKRGARPNYRMYDLLASVLVLFKRDEQFERMIRIAEAMPHHDGMKERLEKWRNPNHPWRQKQQKRRGLFWGANQY